MFIETLKDHNGLVYSYICWEVIGQNGLPKKDGEFIYIDEIWLHDWYSRALGIFKILNLFIPRILSHRMSQNAKYVSWHNDKRDRNVNYNLHKFIKGDKYGRR